MNAISEFTNNKKQVDIIYLHLSKAFNPVFHPLLINQLNSHGCSRHCVEWLQSYFVNRKQRMVIDGNASDWRPVLSGVLEGS